MKTVYLVQMKEIRLQEYYGRECIKGDIYVVLIKQS